MDVNQPEASHSIGSESTRTPEALKREQVIAALNFAIQRIAQIPEDQRSEEDKWILDSVQEAKAGSLDRAKDTYTKTFPNIETGETLSQEEGIPVEHLINRLQRELDSLPPDDLQRKEIEDNLKILKTPGVTKTYEEAHGEKVKDNPSESVILRSRKKEEANIISKDYRGEGTREDEPANYFKAEEALAHRLELQIPGEQVLPSEITSGLAAGKARIEHTRDNRHYQEMERMEEMSRELARAKMTEDRQRWEARFPGFKLKTLVERFWKFTVGEAATYGKEKTHAMKMLAESGLQMTNLPYDFLNSIDQVARANIQNRRRGLGRFIGGVRDLFSEVTFQEKDLHREQTRIINLLRRAAGGSADQEVTQFIQANPNLLQTFRNLQSGDHAASLSLAKRVSSEFGDEVIHTIVGERRTQTPIEFTGEIKNYLVQNVVTPLITEGLANNGNINPDTLYRVRTSVQEMFFQPEFVKWYDTQTDEVKEALKLSLSYGSDIASVVQEVLLPQLLQAKEHGVSLNNLDQYLHNLVLKVNVGTLEAGQKGVMNEGLIERAASRTITNERVLGIYQELRNQNQAPTIVPDTYLNAAVSRAEVLGKALRGLTNPVLAGVAVGVGTYLLSRSGNLALPIIGGALTAGVMRGLQERRLFTREYEQHELEKELGYQFPTGAKRREGTRWGGRIERPGMRQLEMHKRVMETELTNPMRQGIQEIESGNDVSVDNLLRLSGLIVDTNARFRLMDESGMGLLSATDNNPQVYQPQRNDLELTRAEAQVALRNYLNTHQDQLDEINQRLGLPNPPQGVNQVDFILEELTSAQMDHLENGLGLNPNYQAALGNLTIAQRESITARENAFRRVRNLRTIQGGLITTAGVLGGYVATNWLINGVVNLVEDLRNIVGGEVNLRGSMEELVKNGQSGVVESGDVRIEVNPDGKDPGTIFISHDNATFLGHGSVSDDGTPHIKIDPNEQGNMSEETLKEFKSELQKKGWQVDTQHIIGEKVTEKPIVGPDGQWSQHTTNVDHRELVNSPDRIRLHTFKDGEKIILDLSTMQNDTQGVYVTLGDTPQDGIWIPAVDHKVVLDPNDMNTMIDTPKGKMPLGEITKMVENQEAIKTLANGDIATEVHSRQDVFNLNHGGKDGFIEAGKLTPGQNGQGSTLQVFATIRGSHVIDPNIKITEPFTKDLVDLIPPEGHGLAEPFHTDFGIPILIPRRPLEQPVGRPQDQTPGQPGQQDGQRTPNQVEQTIPVERQNIDRQRREAEHALERQRQERQRLENDHSLSGEEWRRRREEIDQNISELESLRDTTENHNLPEGPLSVNEIFGRIQGSVPQNHEYFVENPPEKVALTPEQLADLTSNKPFFVNIQESNGIISYETNKEIVPFVWDPKVSAARFIDAENQTAGDSGTLALAAVSADTPEKQAALYRAITDGVLKIHEEDPNKLLLWLQAQSAGDQLSSLARFMDNDLMQTQGGVSLRPERERLLTWDETNLQINPDSLANFPSLWQKRIQELRQALAADQLQPHHLRWIEFLSHSVDLPKLIQIIKEQQPPEAQTPNQPTPPTPAPPSTTGPTPAPVAQGSTLGAQTGQPTAEEPTETLAATAPKVPSGLESNREAWARIKEYANKIIGGEDQETVLKNVESDYWKEQILKIVKASKSQQASQEQQTDSFLTPATREIIEDYAKRILDGEHPDQVLKNTNEAWKREVMRVVEEQRPTPPPTTRIVRRTRTPSSPEPTGMERMEAAIDRVFMPEEIKSESVSEEEVNRIMNEVKIHGEPFRNERLIPVILRNEKLTPQVKVPLEGTNVYLSLPYDLGEGRQAVMAYVEKGGEVVARSFYRSNSQGIWRYLPKYILKDNRLVYYQKGHGEESVTVPMEIQQVLASMTERGKTVLATQNRELIFAGTARPTDYMGTIDSEVIPTPVKLEGNFYAETGKIKPEEVKFTNPDQAPDFSRMLASWDQDTTIYQNQKVKVEVFPSKDGQFKYLFCRDSKNRAWIGGVENGSEVTSLGVRKSWVKAGDLTTPAFEYGNYAYGYGNQNMRNGNYVDMFQNYLSKVPVIQEYIESVSQR